MRKVLVVLGMVLLLAGFAAAAEQTEVMATVQQFVDGFNKGDVNAALATCAEQVSIIDEFPPYQWSGTGACLTWAQAYDAGAKDNSITDSHVTLGKPRHVDITGDRAYVVVPANYTWKEKGKPMKEIGSTLTVALQKSASGWRITSWAWSKQ